MARKASTKKTTTARRPAAKRKTPAARKISPRKAAAERKAKTAKRIVKMSTPGTDAPRSKTGSAKSGSTKPRSATSGAKRGAARKAPARAAKTRTGRAKAAPLPKSKRNTGTGWSAENETELRALIKGNTPTRVIGLKMGRSEASVRSKVQKLGLSLMPPNRSPYNRT